MDIFKIEEKDKLHLVAQAVPQLFDAMTSMSRDNELSADDIIDFFALCLAAMLDNDSHLKTPRDLRLGVQTVSKHIEQRVKELRAAQEVNGYSFLSKILGQAGVDLDEGTTH